MAPPGEPERSLLAIDIGAIHLSAV